ncbi:MAG: 4Fe-4S dicluster domain-containing protein [Armatimonadetes bacterium]|nr:4Fe-4S dicluster domain-containing protein [Armatimonadota bacterium]
MQEFVLEKSDLSTWLAAMAVDHEVVGPQSQASGPPAFQPLPPGVTPLLDNGQWTLPPKDHILPRSETLFTFQRTPEGPAIIPGIPRPQATVLIGLRPCDLRSLSILDEVYLDGRFKDPYYKARRDNLLTVAYVCEKKRWSCFCSSVGDPVEWAAAADVSLTDIGERYVVCANSPAGETLARLIPMALVTESDIAQRDCVWEELRVAERKFDASEAAEFVNWDSAEWTQLAERCIGCGVCSYLCPTCTCFDIQDEELSGGCVERYRVRDTCQFCDFTHMGHGHNPRPGKPERIRQRVSHKFKYIVEQCGILGCVGCGRCVELCPVNTDLREVLKRMSDSHEHQSVST